MVTKFITEKRNMALSSFRKLAPAALIFAYLVFGYIYVHIGILGLDEGWYLYASKLVWQGKMLYRDFSYTQPPLLPYVYGLPQLLAGQRLYAGRLESLLFGGAAIALAMLAAGRLRGKSAAIVCGCCIVFNPFTVYHLVIAKPYALATLLLSAAICSLVASGNRWWRYPLTAFYLALAAGVRLSLLAPLAVFCILVLVIEWKEKRRFISAAIVSAITLGFIYFPCWLADRQNFWFSLVDFHIGSFRHLSASSLIYEKLDRLGTLASNIWLLGLMSFGAGATFWLWRKGSLVKRLGDHKHYLYIGGILISLFVANLLPPAMQADYHIIMIPTMGVLSGCAFSKWFEMISDKRVKQLLLALFASALVVNALGGNHFLDARGRMGPIDKVQEIAATLNRELAPDEVVFTFQGYIAVEAGRQLVPGLEMSIFSYYPEWQTDLCQKRKVVNSDMILDFLENGQPGAVILTERDYGLESVLHPLSVAKKAEIKGKLKAALERNYHLVRSYDQVGQWREPAYLYLRNSVRQ
jgi:4-amino-4-deoxy-L-arabinose transferase-like glycosyltransferase